MSSTVEAPRGRPRKYTDAELLEAMRDVLAASEYRSLSMRIYDEERPDGYPNGETIARSLGTWTEARQLLEAASSAD